MLFDKQTGDAPSPAGPKISFALSFSHNAKPALYGDNQSAFSVQLTKEGVIALREALQGRCRRSELFIRLIIWRFARLIPFG
ncbi:hypothetical protein [Cohnella faecalis]|uniref:hypothetical protein n=1 Tax=Cohnella faecalis TaxID=2315694 RepID=UPI000E5AF11C|nr:hypothetical protein [Cohnella faecalis]